MNTCIKVNRKVNWGRWLSLLLMFFVSGCASTYTVQRVQQNPLPRLAKELEAEGKYTVKMRGDDHLELRNTWVFCSIIGLGPYAFEANLDYRDHQVYGEHYLQANGLWTLWAPVYLDAGPGFVGAILRPAIRREKDDILQRIGGENIRERHSGFRSLEERLKE